MVPAAGGGWIGVGPDSGQRGSWGFIRYYYALAQELPSQTYGVPFRLPCRGSLDWWSARIQANRFHIRDNEELRCGGLCWLVLLRFSGFLFWVATFESATGEKPSQLLVLGLRWMRILYGREQSR